MMMETQTTLVAEPSFGWKVRLPRSLDDARRLVEEALKEQGFGVLTEIDFRAAMQKKLGKDFRPYVVLGACNPNLAHQALGIDLNVGLLLPCNVVLWDDVGATVVAFARPAAMLQIVGDPALAPIAEEAERRLRAAFVKISAS
jgi:uncharacterized protein (DUF302 family)